MAQGVLYFKPPAAKELSGNPHKSLDILFFSCKLRVGMSKKHLPARAGAIIFRGKAALLQLKRGTENLFDAGLKRPSFAGGLSGQQAIAESKTALWTESAPEERFLQAGNIHNLRLAVKKLHGLEIPAGVVFSFWKHVGRADRRRGYVAGRELREGCIIPSTGGGLCQLSNALYDAALQANFEIVERYAHTQNRGRFPGGTGPRRHRFLELCRSSFSRFICLSYRSRAGQRKSDRQI
jgi:hypothetical protein